MESAPANAEGQNTLEPALHGDDEFRAIEERIMLQVKSEKQSQQQSAGKAL